ncbi:MAG: ABC transporter ATP-binding protein [Lachnospiraceae bacterium]|nr:ABC transporter ATP-binding protein [Lachnospiraceae bacterium]
MKRILRYVVVYLPRMLGGLAIKVLGTLTDLGLPWVLAFMIDDVIPKKSLSLVAVWGVVMLVLAVVTRALNVQANRMASSVARDVTRAVRHDLYEKIMSLSGRQVDQFTIPSLVSRMTSDTYNIHHAVGMIQRIGVRAPMILLGGIAITFTLDVVLTLVLIATLPFIAVLVWFISSKGIPMYTRVQQAVDQMVQVVRENVTGVRVIKALSKGEGEKRRFDKINEETSSREVKASSTMSAINPIMNLILNIGLTLVIVVGAYRVNEGRMDVGKIVAFLSYFTMILNAMMSINRIFVMLSKATASANRISEVLEAPAELMPTPVESVANGCHIEFDHVKFAYYGAGATGRGGAASRSVSNGEEIRQNIDDISFRLKQGESLGIIGSTGSGKTTLINLLMRFYDVDEGAVRIHGQDVRSMSLKELREQFGVVFQNDILFADTIRENINFWRDIPEEQLCAAAEDAQAAEFLREIGAALGELSEEAAISAELATVDSGISGQASEELARGLSHLAASKGANLSGGQKQRVLIARALAGKPEILILDDSSSALDYKTDANLRIALRDHLSGTTAIMIAQRISSVRSLDHILVMEDGQCVGYGSHEELMAGCSTYQEIYRSQMGGGDYGRT